MQNQLIVGIDISSATLDICVRSDQKQESVVIKNDTRSINRFLKSFKDEQLIIGMENTGRYNWALYEALAEQQHQVFVIPPVHLKKSMGLVRGKNDKIDAERIAIFTAKNYAELRPWTPLSESVQKLKILLTERNARVKAKRQLLRQQADYSKMKKIGLEKTLLKLNQQQIAQLGKQLVFIEMEIEEIIKSDEQMNRDAALIRSVPGVGKVLCWMLLAKTASFTAIDDPRKMACYSGVVPFDHQSGTSIKGRNRISHYADKSIKTILHMAAMSAIRLQNDLRIYYLRKVAEGKNKMSVLNAIRNKIIHRIYAVIKNQTPYQKNLILS